MTLITWDTGTAYDFFISLFVLHRAADIGLRPSWAAGVRQRISAPRREFLERLFSFGSLPLQWIRSLPDPKDAATVLRHSADLAPVDRLAALILPAETSPEVRATLEKIAKRGSWIASQEKNIKELYPQRTRPITAANLQTILETWAAAAESGETLLAALREYYEAFFIEEENRIRPELERGLLQAQARSRVVSLERLVEELSHGIRFEDLNSIQELILAPSYWMTPLVFHTRPEKDTALIVFGIRPEMESIPPGAGVPDALITTLKSMADPTRLRILRYLNGQPLTPSELSRRLRLRPPTVIHHLKMLRLAGLVFITVSEDGDKRYTTRSETVSGIFNTVQEFINKQD
jgi:DNA-binding transcriptional ArsR family regulator